VNGLTSMTNAMLQGGNSTMASVPAGALLDIGTAGECEIW
jgi:hypothetical protein